MSPAPRKSSAGKSSRAAKSSSGKSPGAAESSHAGKASAGGEVAAPRPPRCKTCGRRIHVPKGWSSGPAVRKHYWAKHPEVMRGPGRSR